MSATVSAEKKMKRSLAGSWVGEWRWTDKEEGKRNQRWKKVLAARARSGCGIRWQEWTGAVPNLYCRPDWATTSTLLDSWSWTVQSSCK